MIKEMIILPFDHRTSFSKDILGTSYKPDKEQREEITNLKKIIFEGFLSTLKKQKNKKSFAILVDEEYGKAILKEAKKKKIKICLPVEKSGKEQLEIEYGKSFGKHVNGIRPDFIKILIRYNPLNTETNKKQLKNLVKIDRFCKKNKYKVILELLVPPAKEDLQCATYDSDKRAERTIEAIKDIKEKLKVAIWKMEGFTKSQWKEIIPLVSKNSRIIFLGRGQDKNKVEKWLRDASQFKEIVGFAIGRTIFLETLKKYHSGKISRDKAIGAIAEKFEHFITLWKKARR